MPSEICIKSQSSLKNEPSSFQFDGYVNIKSYSGSIIVDKEILEKRVTWKKQIVSGRVQSQGFIDTVSAGTTITIGAPQKNIRGGEFIRFKMNAYGHRHNCYIYPENEFYVSICEDNNISSFGSSPAEAQEMLQEALELYHDVYG